MLTYLAMLMGMLVGLVPAQAEDRKGGANAATTAKPAKAEQPTLVGVDSVRAVPLRQTVPVVGRLVARRAGVVAARINGPVEDMRVEVGDRVTKGTVLASLRNDRLDWQRRLAAAAAAEAGAAVKTAEAALALLRQELKRLERLRKSAAFNQARHDDKRHEVIRAESALAEARARVVRDEADLKLAEIDLYNAEIRAPYAGVVSLRHTEAGAYVKVGDPVVSLVGDGELEVEAEVPAVRIGGLSPGTWVSFSVSGDDRVASPLAARVRAVVPSENTRTRTRTVRFVPELADVDRDLAANQSVRLLLPAGAVRDVLSVHKDAVLRRKGQTVVFLDKDGVALVRPVTLGVPVSDRFEVLEGLKPGDLVVVRGNERLRPGQAIRHQGAAAHAGIESAGEGATP